MIEKENTFLHEFLSIGTGVVVVGFSMLLLGQTIYDSVDKPEKIQVAQHTAKNLLEEHIAEAALGMSYTEIETIWGTPYRKIEENDSGETVYRWYVKQTFKYPTGKIFEILSTKPDIRMYVRRVDVTFKNQKVTKIQQDSGNKSDMPIPEGVINE